MQTLKFKIKHEYAKEILKYQREYSSMLHSAFELLKNEDELKSVFNYIQSSSVVLNRLNKLKNTELMNSWFTQSCIKEAYQIVQSFKVKQEDYKKKLQRKSELEQKEKLLKAEKKELKHLQKMKELKVIFGGRNLFKQRCKNQISKEEFKQRRLSPLYSVGTANITGNRLFRITEDLQHVTFQPDRKHHYELKLVGVSKGYKGILRRLYARQELKDLPITYKLTSEYVYISFEEDKLYKDEFNFKKKKDRYCALDLNPNYIGYSIVDWTSSNSWKIIESGVYSFKQLNDEFNSIKGTPSSDERKIYLNNKRRHEVIEVAKNLIEKCCYFKVENFVIEDLDFKNSKSSADKDYNRLCRNQWIRNDFIRQFEKEM